MAIDTAQKRLIVLKRSSVLRPEYPMGSVAAISRGGVLGMYHMVAGSAPALGRRHWARLRRYIT